MSSSDPTNPMPRFRPAEGTVPPPATTAPVPPPVGAPPTPASNTTGTSQPPPFKPASTHTYGPNQGAQVAAAAAKVGGKAAEIANIVLKDGKYHLQRMFQWNLQVVPLTPEEGPQLAAAGITDPTLQRYYAWRRSLLACVLGPLFVSAVLSTIGNAQEFGGLSGLGVIINIILIAAYWGMPIGALMGFLNWTKPNVSFWWTCAGWLVGFCAPFLLAIFPVSWLVDTTQIEAQQGPQGAMLHLLGLGVGINLSLVPVIMSVGPATVRGCLRIKTLSPGSIVPGWFLMVGVPLCILTWMVPLTFINSIALSILLVLGVLAYAGAPSWYVYRSALLTRPCSPTEVARIGPVQKLTLITAAAGVIVILIYTLTHTIMGRRVLGFTVEGAIIRPWSLDLWKFIFEYIARSMFLTAVFADVLLRVSLRVHTQLSAFKSDASSAEHEKAMESLGHVVTKG